MGWSTPSAGGSAATNAGYRPREDASRGAVAKGVAMAAVLAVVAIALGVDPHRIAVATLFGVIVLAPVHAWSELRGLRKGLEAAGTGPLPLIEGTRDDGARSSARSLRDVAGTILVILIVAAFVGYLVFSPEEVFPILVGGVAALPAGEAIVLVWLRRRRARDGMQIYVRNVEGDEETADPPRLHLVPRGR